MTFIEFLNLFAQLSVVLFVVSSMLAMGLRLTVPVIIHPLTNVRLVLLALLANFLLVPLLAYGIILVVPLEQSLRFGLIIMAACAGSPFLSKLVQAAKGDLAFGVGLMVLLMVVTIFYAPFLLPLVLPGVSVNPWDIAKSLIVLMLIPLAIGMLVQSSLPEDAAHWQPVMGKISSVALIIMLVVQLGLNIPSIIDMIGSRGFLAMLLFIAGSLLIGYLLGGRQPGVRNVMALGTAMRNVSAAIVVASQNFSNSDTLSFVLVAGLVMLLGLLPAARRMGALRQAIEPKPTG